MFKHVAEGLHDELQAQRALSRWDNEGGAGPAMSLLKLGPPARQPAKPGLIDAELNRQLELGYLL